MDLIPIFVIIGLVGFVCYLTYALQGAVAEGVALSENGRKISKDRDLQKSMLKDAMNETANVVAQRDAARRERDSQAAQLKDYQAALGYERSLNTKLEIDVMELRKQIEEGTEALRNESKQAEGYRDRLVILERDREAMVQRARASVINTKDLEAELRANRDLVDLWIGRVDSLEVLVDPLLDAIEDRKGRSVAGWRKAEAAYKEALTALRVRAGREKLKVVASKSYATEAEFLADLGVQSVEQQSVEGERKVTKPN